MDDCWHKNGVLESMKKRWVDAAAHQASTGLNDEELIEPLEVRS